MLESFLWKRSLALSTETGFHWLKPIMPAFSRIPCSRLNICQLLFSQLIFPFLFAISVHERVIFPVAQAKCCLLFPDSPWSRISLILSVRKPHVYYLENTNPEPAHCLCPFLFLPGSSYCPLSWIMAEASFLSSCSTMFSSALSGM